MALTNIQRDVCRLLAKQRIVSGESYVAIGILQCHSAVQPLGYLALAATGKDPGLAPDAILREAGRSARYSAAEIAALAFDGPAPDASDLSRRWHAALENATQIVATLPYENIGQCLLRGGALFRGDAAALREVLADGEIDFTPVRSGVRLRNHLKEASITKRPQIVIRRGVEIVVLVPVDLGRRLEERHARR